MTNSRSDPMRVEVVVLRYFPERGFGFVKTASISGDIFLHSSVLEAANMDPPVAGQRLYGQVAQDEKRRDRWRVVRISSQPLDNARSRAHLSQSPRLLRDFLEHELARGALPIRSYLSRIGPQPFFLVAATGVGKTVAVPLHLYLQLSVSAAEGGSSSGDSPRIYVVEPTIPLCRREAEHMNDAYRAFLRDRNQSQARHLPFGHITGSGKFNPRAPIVFITTGVFELIARSDDYDPALTRFVIDEAHRILAQQEGVEIAVAVARGRGTCIDFMSATVDTATLAADLSVSVIEATEERFPVIKATKMQPLDACIADLAFDCLLNPQAAPIPKPTEFTRDADRRRCERLRLHLLSLQSYVDPIDGQTYPGLLERPQGMLVIVNSHRGERADTRRIAELLRSRFSTSGQFVEVLRLASAVERDVDQRRSFEQRIASIESARGRYVIVATSVVEMGLTFPSLDFIVTMDTELETALAYGGEVIRERPLGVNAFLQRIGRVGRKRPGIAFVSREATRTGGNPDWSSWSADRLARELQVEPIRYALSRSDMRELAFFAYEHDVRGGIRFAADFLADYRLPSKPQNSPELLGRLVAERNAIRGAGLSNDGVRLNQIGKRFREIRLVRDLALGRILAHCCLSESQSVATIAAVAAASDGIALSDILGRGLHLEDVSALKLTQAFEQDEFKKPLGAIYELFTKTPSNVSARHLGTSETTAHRIAELLRRGYSVQEPIAPQGSGARSSKAAFLEFARVAIPLDPCSEVLSLYSIARHFLERYWGDLGDPTLAEFERERARRSLRHECVLLGLDSRRVNQLLSRIVDLIEAANLLPRSPNRENTGVLPTAQALCLKIRIEVAAGRCDPAEAERQLALVANHASDRSSWPLI